MKYSIGLQSTCATTEEMRILSEEMRSGRCAAVLGFSSMWCVPRSYKNKKEIKK